MTSWTGFFREQLVKTFPAIYGTQRSMSQDHMIYLLTAIRLTPGGSSTVHIYTQTVHGTTQITTEQHK